ncbi:hypothetical protein NPIL_194051 [Nephila pilipes]|uniref:Uncharacterized protein n=1 Tax=Nephila pilipes TaxID=299642 RepID=A0A8X6MSW7_NEPPI|nr:hypothetical protein NPIL_194051 [Nephila pilipes]
MKTYSDQAILHFLRRQAYRKSEVLIRLRSEIGHDESIHRRSRFEGGGPLHVLTDLSESFRTPRNGYSLGNDIKLRIEQKKKGGCCANSVCSGVGT